MVDPSNAGSGAGSCLEMVAVAVVSTGVILASYYHLHHRLDADLKLNKTIEQRRQSRTTSTKKRVRFADDVAAPPEPSPDGEDYRQLRRAATGGELIRPALRKA